MLSTKFTEARTAFWNAQDDFRRECIHEMQSLMPEGVAMLLLEVNEVPRLAASAYIVDSGDEYHIDNLPKDLADALDEIAVSMGVSDWDEAYAFLFTHGDGRFEIRAALADKES